MNFRDILHGKDNIVQKNGSLREDIKVLPLSVMHLGAVLVFFGAVCGEVVWWYEFLGYTAWEG